MSVFHKRSSAWTSCVRPSLVWERQQCLYWPPCSRSNLWMVRSVAHFTFLSCWVKWLIIPLLYFYRVYTFLTHNLYAGKQTEYALMEQVEFGVTTVKPLFTYKGGVCVKQPVALVLTYIALYDREMDRTYNCLNIDQCCGFKKLIFNLLISCLDDYSFWNN